MVNYQSEIIYQIHCSLLQETQKTKPAFPFRIKKRCQIKQWDIVTCCILDCLVLVLLHVVFITNFQDETRKGEVASTQNKNVKKMSYWNASRGTQLVNI